MGRFGDRGGCAAGKSDLRGGNYVTENKAVARIEIIAAVPRTAQEKVGGKNCL